MRGSGPGKALYLPREHTRRASGRLRAFVRSVRPSECPHPASDQTHLRDKRRHLARDRNERGQKKARHLSRAIGEPAPGEEGGIAENNSPSTSIPARVKKRPHCHSRGSPRGSCLKRVRVRQQPASLAAHGNYYTEMEIRPRTRASCLGATSRARVRACQWNSGAYRRMPGRDSRNPLAPVTRPAVRVTALACSSSVLRPDCAPNASPCTTLRLPRRSDRPCPANGRQYWRHRYSP